MAEGFTFQLNIAGLVIWYPWADGRTGSLIGIGAGKNSHNENHSENSAEKSHSGRHHAQHIHPHLATLTYRPQFLAKLERNVPAPDPLVAGPDGSLFARRILMDEVLWIEPTWFGLDDHLLEAEIPNLLSLRALDTEVEGVDEGCMSFDLSGSAATTRLDFMAGKLKETDHIDGDWQIRFAGEAQELEAHDAGSKKGNHTDLGKRKIASRLALTFSTLKSLTIHSSKNPSLRFQAKGKIDASFSVEPSVDFVPDPFDRLPHLESVYGAVRWKNQAPLHFKKPFPNPEDRRQLTIKDRACPPVGI